MYGNFHTKRRSGENLPVFFLFLDSPLPIPSHISHISYSFFPFEKRRQSKRCLVVYRISHASLRNLNTSWCLVPYSKKSFQKKFFTTAKRNFEILNFPSFFDPPPTWNNQWFLKIDRISFDGTVWGTEVSESPPIIIKGVGGRAAALEMADIKCEKCVRRCELENPAIPRKKEKIQTSFL